MRGLYHDNEPAMTMATSSDIGIGCLLDLLNDNRAVGREEAALKLLSKAEESLKESSKFTLPLGLSGER